MSQCKNGERDLFIEELRSNGSIYTKQPSLTEKFGWIKKNRTEEEYVDYLLDTVKRFLIAREEVIQNRQNLTDEQLQKPIDYAYILYGSRLFSKMLDLLDETNSAGIPYLEKVTAHERSLDLVIKCFLRRKEDLGEIYSNITWQIVSSVERKQQLSITPKDVFKEIFTDLTHSTNEAQLDSLSVVSWDSIYDQHCKKLKDYDEKPALSVHLHPEILLIDYLLEKQINSTIEPGEIEIGISKLPCFLCSIYIDLLNQKHGRRFAAPQCSHGKIYSKWSVRQTEDPAIVQALDEILVEKLQRAIQELRTAFERGGTKRSGDSDIMDISLEDEEFDARERLNMELEYDDD